MARELDNLYKPDEWWVTKRISELIENIPGTESYRYDTALIQREGAHTVYSILLGDHKYSPRRETESYYLDEHPFSADMQEKMVILLGNIGISSSIGIWIKQMTRLFSEYVFVKHGPTDEQSLVQKFVVYGFTETMNGGHELGEVIVVEAVGETDCYIVGGVNNYSGEGGSAWSTLWTVLKHWSLTLEVPIEYRKLPESVYKTFSDEVQNLEERMASEFDERID